MEEISQQESSDVNASTGIVLVTTGWTLIRMRNKRNSYETTERKISGSRSHGKPGSRWEIEVKMDFRETGYEEVSVSKWRRIVCSEGFRSWRYSDIELHYKTFNLDSQAVILKITAHFQAILVTVQNT
jgi:hypothetical protein